MTQPILLSLVMFLISSCSAQEDSPERLFWRWFQANEIRLFDFKECFGSLRFMNWMLRMAQEVAHEISRLD